jgi:hypothetical protein
MDHFARLRAADRRAFITEAASWRNLTPVIIEKDLWVLWVLGRFTTSAAACDGHVSALGGTSLVRRTT